MEIRPADHRVHPAWWTAILIAIVVATVWLCSASFAGALTSVVSVTLMSDRAGLVMETGAKVKMRGVQVGQVAGVEGAHEPVRLKLSLLTDQVKHIPANVTAQIRATTIFGAKHVDLIYPDKPSAQHLLAGAVLRSSNVTAEVNTVFQNLAEVLDQVDPPKLNAVLTALADAVRGRGERMGEATSAMNRVLLEVNHRMETMQQDWRALSGASDAYSAAAQDILAVLDAGSTTSVTIADHSSELDALLLNTISASQAGIDLVGPNQDNLVRAINTLVPTDRK